MQPVELGDIANPQFAAAGKPLDGVRILALETMQALPWATQLLARMGAEVIKIEAIIGGDQGRGSLPALKDPSGRNVGATFLRNNLNKKSVCIDLKSRRGVELVLELTSRFDVVAENFRAGTLDRLGLGYEAVSAANPQAVYLSVSGFGHSGSTYGDLPAFAAVAEAMSGIYDLKRVADGPPLVAPVGALGDIGTAQFAAIGLLAALRQRDRTGKGSHVDVAMFDSMVAMTDIVTNFWSMGLENGQLGPLIMHSFRSADGWFVVQVGREEQFERLAQTVGQEGWLNDDRFATRQGWIDHLAVIRAGIESWASSQTSLEACRRLGSAGVAAGPVFDAPTVAADPHLAERNMLVETPRPDGGRPVLVPGNPIKISGVAEGPEQRVPWLGEHTDSVLASELDLSRDDLTELREAGVIG